MSRPARYVEDDTDDEPDYPTVPPRYCSHPEPFFEVNVYPEPIGGTVEVELSCVLCESLVYDVIEMTELATAN